MLSEYKYGHPFNMCGNACGIKFRTGAHIQRLNFAYFDERLIKSMRLFDYVDKVANFMYDSNPDSSGWCVSKKYADHAFEIMHKMVFGPKHLDYDNIVSDIKTIDNPRLVKFMLNYLKKDWKRMVI